MTIHNNQPIPKIIHFIWIGNPLKTEYLKEILLVAKVAKQSGFEINLWLDNEMHFYKAAVSCDINKHSLILRNISEIYEWVIDDPFYAKNKGFKLIQFVNSERVGLANLAAASDILRYEILRKLGGYYFDTDTLFFANTQKEEINDKINRKTEVISAKYYRNHFKISHLRFTTDTPVLGMKIATYKSAYELNEMLENGEAGGNDIIGTVPNHCVFEKALDECLDIYRKNRYYAWKEKCPKDQKSCEVFAEYIHTYSKNELKITSIPFLDIKRDKYKFYRYIDGQEQNIKNTRLKLTSRWSGPLLLQKIIRDTFSIEETISINIDVSKKYADHVRSIAGVDIVSRSHQSWLDQEKLGTSSCDYESTMLCNSNKHRL